MKPKKVSIKGKKKKKRSPSSPNVSLSAPGVEGSTKGYEMGNTWTFSPEEKDHEEQPNGNSLVVPRTQELYRRNTLVGHDLVLHIRDEKMSRETGIDKEYKVDLKDAIVTFSFNNFIWEFLIQGLVPFSTLYLLIRYGRGQLEQRQMTGLKKHPESIIFFLGTYGFFFYVFVQFIIMILYPNEMTESRLGAGFFWSLTLSFLKLSVISIKYGYRSQSIRERSLKNELTYEERRAEEFGSGWSFPTSFVIRREIELAAHRRGESISTPFLFNGTVKEYQELFRLACKHGGSKDDIKESKLYPGYVEVPIRILAFYIFSLSQYHPEVIEQEIVRKEDLKYMDKESKFLNVMIILSMAMLIIPLTTRTILLYFGFYKDGEDGGWDDVLNHFRSWGVISWIILGNIIFSTLHQSIVVFNFTNAGVMDVGRRLENQKRLTCLLYHPADHRGNNRLDTRLRLDTTIPRNLIAWLRLKKVMNVIGDNYRKRLSSFTGILLITILLLETLALYALITGGQMENMLVVQELLFTVTYVSILMMIYLVIILNLGQKTNYESAINQISEVRSSKIRISYLIDHFSTKKEEGLSSQLSSSQSLLHDINEFLTIEDIQNPLELLGQRMDNAFTKSLITLLFSVIGVVFRIALGSF